MTTTKLNKAFLYARVSVEERGRQKDTIPAQLDRLQQFCDTNGLEVCGTFIDDGISAKDIKKRKDFSRMLERLDEVDVVLFTRLDRFSRNMQDAGNLLALFERHQCAFRAVDENDVDVTTADGRFLFNLQISLAERERLKTSERIKAVNAYRLKEGRVICGSIPLGYRIENKKPVIDPEGAELVRRIYALFIQYQSVGKVRRDLKEEGYNYSMAGLRKILGRREYTGRYHGIDSFFPSIIDDQLFEEVQRIRQKGTRQRQHTYMFSGLVRCGVCHYAAIGSVNKGVYLLYRCTGYRSNPDAVEKHNLSVAERKIEDYLINHICEDLRRAQVKRRAKKKKVQKKPNPAAIRKKMTKLKELYLLDMIQLEDYREEYLDLVQQLKEAESQPKPQPKIDIELLEDVIKRRYSTMSREEKRTFWSQLIDHIDIYKGGIVRPFYRLK